VERVRTRRSGRGGPTAGVAPICPSRRSPTCLTPPPPRFRQGGDCAEGFAEFNTNHIRDTYRLLLQMAMVLQFSSGLPVIKLGRVAGQFAKPRSEGMETRSGVSLPSYRGDIINAEEFTAGAREPDPARMVKAYNQSATTLNLLRAFSTGGYSDLSRLHAWNLDFVGSSPEGAAYEELAGRISECLSFLRACGVDTSEGAAFKTTSFYTSHEALLLEYESALTREDSTTGLWYGCSAHYLWLGERTRQLDGAHIEYLRGVGNPLGVKVSDKADPAEVVRLCDALNPENEAGRLTIVCRMGAQALHEKYPAIVRAVSRAGHKVVWQSDPMHGNTFKAANGYKTRAVESIRDELVAFFDVHAAEGTHPGGIHLELTGKDVTECVGGRMKSLTVDELSLRYHTHCDPRLNASQSLELAFLVAQKMREQAGKGANGLVTGLL
jgi:3-deoxy-7-phosphoheptulonate synthase